MVFSMATRLIAFLFKIYLSRTVGAEALGLFSMGLAVFGLLTMVSSSGIPLTVSRKVAEADALKLPYKAHGIVSSGLLISILFNTLTIGLFFLLREQILSLFADQRAESVVWILLPATFSTCIYNVLRSYFMGRKNYVLYSVTELVEEILNVVAVLLLLSGSIATVQGDHALALAFTVCDIICLVLIVIMYFCIGGRLRKPHESNQILKSSTPITLMRLFTSLAATFTAIILPNRLVSAGMSATAATAVYGQAVGMAYPLLFAPLAITSALSVVLLPEIAQLSITNYSSIAPKVDKGMWYILLVAGFCFTVYASMGKELGLMLFDDATAGKFVMFSAGMVFPLCMSQLTNTTMNSLGLEARCFAHSMVGLVAMALCLWFLPSVLGIYALAVAQTAFFLISFLLNTITLVRRKAMGLAHAKPFIWHTLGMLVICTGTTLLRTALTPHLSVWPRGIICCAFCGILYALLLILTKAVDLKKICLLFAKRKKSK